MSPIEPDTKDWAEVLDTGCAECGFTGRENVIELSTRIAEAAASWSPVLARADAAERPRADRWSAVEYAAHLRDVLTEFRGRTLLMLTEEAPTLPNFDGDAVALESDYRHQTAAEVLDGLNTAATACAEIGRAHV